MKQITEDYVSFEIAQLLKEKGFDERVISYYTESGLEGYMFALKATKNTELDNGFISRPTYQMALKWLREVYNIHIEIRYVPDKFTDEPCYKAVIWDMSTEIGTPLSPDVSYTYFETCVDAALKYTLENLI